MKALYFVTEKYRSPTNR